MKQALVLFTLLVTLALASDGSQDNRGAKVACNSQCVQASLLRMGMNLEVGERIRSGDVQSALKLLNTMNVLEVTPLLHAPEDKSLVEMKRRVYRKLLAERSRIGPTSTGDPETDKLNNDIDTYLKKYQ